MVFDYLKKEFQKGLAGPEAEEKSQNPLVNSYANGLQCRNCRKMFSKGPLFVCDDCNSPLEVSYDYEAIRHQWKKEDLKNRPMNIWRYRELLPLEKPPRIGHQTGMSPFLRAERLERKWGVKELYIKNDGMIYPTLSFKDRVVSVSISKAIEFGFLVVGAASTGNLANSVASHAAQVGLPAYLFVPSKLELAKRIGTAIYGAHLIEISGNYDEVNRFCGKIVERYPWGIVNVNLRPYYAEGSKTVAFEIAEQLDWNLPQNIVVPMAGGSLITKIWKGFTELYQLGWVNSVPTKVFGAQAAGCAPIAAMIKNNTQKIKVVKPKTIAKSIAIGNPADGSYACQVIRESAGSADVANDREIVEGINELAQTEGIFTETAGGVTIAVAKKLIENGKINRHESIVICLTGNGLKTIESVANRKIPVLKISPTLTEFRKLISKMNRY